MCFSYGFLMIEESIMGLDFDPLRTLLASIDENGVCLISDVDTNIESYHLNLGTKFGKLFAYFKRFFKYFLI